MMTNPLSGNSGPSNGNNSRRSRNTLVNNASKYAAPVSSAGAVQYGDQLAQARYQYLSQLSQLRAQGGLIRQNRIMSEASARAAVPGQMAAVEGDALDRGVLGGSADLGARSGVLADRTAALAAARAEAAGARLGLQTQRIGAQGDYYNQLGSINNAMAQERMSNTTNRFAQDQFDALQQNYQDVLRRLRQQKRGDAPQSRRGAGQGRHGGNGNGPRPFTHHNVDPYDNGYGGGGNKGHR